MLYRCSSNHNWCITVGYNSVIGAGSVVNDVTNNAIEAGNPAKLIDIEINN